MTKSGHQGGGVSLPSSRYRLSRLRMALLVTLAVIATGIMSTGSAAAENPGILVGFDSDADRTERFEAIEAVDGEVVRSFGLVPGLKLVEIPEDTPRRQARDLLSDLPGVEFTSNDTAMEIDLAANDPLLAEQWGITAIRAPAAWDTTTGSPDIAVAVLDTGIDLDHPDLAGNLWTNPGEIADNGIDDDSNGFIDDVHGWDFVNDDPVPDDDQSHGTHTAGTVGAVGNNGIGVAGVAWEVSLVPLKICSATGRCLVSDAIAALDYAVREGIEISNNSYGYTGGCTTAFGAAIEAAGRAGHLFVTSAGNEGRDIDVSPKYPAACLQDNVLSVAWLANEKTLAAKSNYGTRGVDLGAPGGSILSTIPGGTYATKSGTSMAGPHVAGAAALVKSAEPELGWSEVKGRIMETTRPVCGLPVLTGGVLDLEAAVAEDPPTFAPCPDPPVIVSGPMTLTGSTTASVTFTGDDGAAFRCRLDSGPWEPCQSPVSYSELSDGAHTVRITQTLGDGPESEASSWTWTVDTVAPAAPTVSNAPISPTIQQSATFTFSGEAGARFECSLDAGPPTTCSSPHTVSGLVDGQHSFAVTQTDRAGNRSPETVRSWTVAARPPEPPVIASGPESLVRVGSASIEFSGETGTSARCRLERNGIAGPWTPCSSPLVLTGLSDGDYRLAMTLTNGAGAESDPAEWIWTVDTTAPESPRIETGPASFDLDSAEISFSGEVGGSFECRLESPGGADDWEACVSPVGLGELEEGLHIFEVRQLDPAGNSSSAASVEWTVDTTPPASPTIEEGPAGSVPSDAAEFTVSGESGAVRECRLADGESTGEWATCPEGFRWSGLSEGSKRLEVRLRDLAGNLSIEAVREWIVDTVAPEAPNLSRGPDPVTSSDSASISIGAEPGATVTCRLDGGPWTPCPDGFRAEGLADGVRLLRARQSDRAGNLSAEASWLWVVDTVAPEAPSIAAGPSGLTGKRTVGFLLEAEEDARLECRFGSGPWNTCPEPIAFGPLPDGPGLATFRQVDRAGNVSGVIARSWTVDATPPKVTRAWRMIDRRGRIRLSVRATDPGSGPRWLEVSFSSTRPSARADRRVRWNGRRPVAVGRSMTPFWIRVVDRAGSRSDWIRLKKR